MNCDWMCWTELCPVGELRGEAEVAEEGVEQSEYEVGEGRDCAVWGAGGNERLDGGKGVEACCGGRDGVGKEMLTMALRISGVFGVWHVVVVGGAARPQFKAMPREELILNDQMLDSWSLKCLKV